MVSWYAYNDYILFLTATYRNIFIQNWWNSTWSIKSQNCILAMSAPLFFNIFLNCSIWFMKKRITSNQSGKPSKSKVIWTYLIIGIGLICCYLGVYHTHQYDASLTFIMIIAGCLCVFTLQNIWFAAKNPKWDKIRGLLAVLLVALPITFGVYKLQ